MNARVRLAGFALVLLAAFGSGYALGDWTHGSGPAPAGDEQRHSDQDHPMPPSSPGGPVMEVSGE